MSILEMLTDCFVRLSDRLVSIKYRPDIPRRDDKNAPADGAPVSPQSGSVPRTSVVETGGDLPVVPDGIAAKVGLDLSWIGRPGAG